MTKLKLLEPEDELELELEDELELDDELDEELELDDELDEALEFEEAPGGCADCPPQASSAAAIRPASRRFDLRIFSCLFVIFIGAKPASIWQPA